MSILRDKIEDALYAVLHELDSDTSDDDGSELAEWSGIKEALEAGLPGVIERHGHNSHEAEGVQWLIDKLTN